MKSARIGGAITAAFLCWMLVCGLCESAENPIEPKNSSTVPEIVTLERLEDIGDTDTGTRVIVLENVYGQGEPALRSASRFLNNIPQSFKARMGLATLFHRFGRLDAIPLDIRLEYYTYRLGVGYVIPFDDWIKRDAGERWEKTGGDLPFAYWLKKEGKGSVPTIANAFREMPFPETATVLSVGLILDTVKKIGDPHALLIVPASIQRVDDLARNRLFYPSSGRGHILSMYLYDWIRLRGLSTEVGLCEVDLLTEFRSCWRDAVVWLYDPESQKPLSAAELKKALDDAVATRDERDVDIDTPIVLKCDRETLEIIISRTKDAKTDDEKAYLKRLLGMASLRYALIEYIQKNGLDHDPEFIYQLSRQVGESHATLLRKRFTELVIWPKESHLNVNDVEAQHDFFMSNRDYFIYLPQKQKWALDEAAKNAFVSAAKWRLIPEEKRKQWNNLSGVEQRQLIAEAAEKLASEETKQPASHKTPDDDTAPTSDAQD